MCHTTTPLRWMPFLRLLADIGLLGAGAIAGYALAARRHRGHRLPVRTEDELREAVTHVAYEFVGLERALAAFQLPQGSGGQRRFDLEAALLHARNLIDFFWAPTRNRRAHRNGIYAAHYLSHWTDIRSGLPQGPNQRYEAISGQLAHISVVRAHGGAHDFATDINAIATELGTAWQRWRDNLPTAWRSILDAQVAHWRVPPKYLLARPNMEMELPARLSALAPRHIEPYHLVHDVRVQSARAPRLGGQRGQDAGPQLISDPLGRADEFRYLEGSLHDHCS